MRCSNCQTELLSTYTYCPKCGKVVTCQSAVPSTTSSSIQASSSLATRDVFSPTQDTRTSVPPFTEFQRRKGQERVSNYSFNGSGSSKKGNKRVCEAQISIGLMSCSREGVLKSIRGKPLLLKVSTSIDKSELLRKAIDKHAAHDRAFLKDQDWQLSYPDGTMVNTIPGK